MHTDSGLRCWDILQAQPKHNIASENLEAMVPDSDELKTHEPTNMRGRALRSTPTTSQVFKEHGSLNTCYERATKT